MAKRTAKKRVTKKRSTTKKTARRSATRTPKPKIAPVTSGKARTKSDVYTQIADNVGITKKEVAQVFDVMNEMMVTDLKKVGSFNVPGMMKVVLRRKPATRARKGINPFTGEEMMFKAKPATNVVKIRPLKALKDRV